MRHFRDFSKKLVPSLVIILLLSTTCGKSTDERNEILYPRYYTYQDIPGVTQEEIRAIENIRATRSLLIFGAHPSTEAFFREDGTPGGYCGLLVGKLYELFGIPVNLGIFEGDDLLTGLEKHTIDLTGELSATPERNKIYHMTMTSLERSIKVMRIPGSEALDQIARKRPVNYGFFKGTDTLDKVKNYLSDPYNVVFAENYKEAHALMKSGDIDAFLDESPAVAAFDIQGDIVSEDFFPLVYNQVSISTANPALAPIITVLDKYLKASGTKELAGFANLGYQEYEKFRFLNKLNMEEKRYIMDRQAQGGIIPIGTEYDNYPVSFWNEREKEWQGIALDVLKEIEKLSDLRFVSQNKKNDDWSVLLKILESGEVSMITELVPTEDRLGKFLWSDQPYVVDYYALLSKNEYPDISINEVLFSRVGLIKNTAHEMVFREWFPRHTQIYEFDSYPEIVDAMQKDTIDLFMANNNTLLWISNYLELPGFKANIIFNRPYESYFGFNKEEIILSSIINKALKLIDTDSHADHWTYRVFDYRSKMAQAQVPWLAGFLLLAVLMLALLANMLIRNHSQGRQLESIIHQRTQDLEAQTAAAQIASKAKGEFLAHMSHEIRTPLNAIIGMTVIALKYAESDRTKSALDEISTASNHLLGILNDILDMSKIESGKFALIHEPFALLEALEEVCDIIKMRCFEKQLQFIHAFENIPDVTVMGDKLRLKQVLINLLGNSVKFTPNRGQIELRCVKALEDANELFFSFSVRDSGIGMTEEQIQKLFTPFEQTDNKIAVRFGGTGLGLAISQDLVTQMGGQISVKSKPGEGSVFSFIIGLQVTDPLKKKIQMPDDYIPDLRGKHFLLAEDVEINRIIIQELLLETHVEMEEAIDGQEAVDKFSSSAPGYYDFIFMDIQMPNMNGYEAACRIREIEKERSSQNINVKPVPIFAMTANAYREDIDRAIQAGMNGHLAKPVDMKIVIKALAEHFPTVQIHREIQ